MQHAGDRSVRAGAHVGRGARDRAGDADAAEQRRRDVRDALRDQLAIRAVAPAGHAVGHDGREQRLDRAEQRERDGARQHRLHLGKAELRQRRHRQAARECRRTAVPMVATGKCQQRRRGAAPATAISMPGQCGRSFFSADDDGDRGDRERDASRHRSVGRAAPEHGQLLQQRAGLRPGELEPQQLA